MSSQLLSIIMPVYNSEKYIKEAIESIIDQSYKNWELLLINDGSTDKSESICKAYECKDNRIHLYSQKNQGSQIARNEGLKKASGELISFIDSDDILHKDMFQILIDNMNQYNAEISACDVSFDINEFNSSDAESFSLVIRGNNNVLASVVGGKSNIPRIYGYMWNKIYSRKIIDNFFFNENINIGEDGLFNISLLRNCKSAAYTSRKLYYYRQYGDSLTKTHTRAYSFWAKEVAAYGDILANDTHNELQEYCKQMLVFCYLKKGEAIIREKRMLSELYSDRKELKKLGSIEINDKNAAILYQAYMQCMPVFVSFKYLFLKLKGFM